MPRNLDCGLHKIQEVSANTYIQKRSESCTAAAASACKYMYRYVLYIPMLVRLAQLKAQFKMEPELLVSYFV